MTAAPSEAAPAAATSATASTAIQAAAATVAAAGYQPSATGQEQVLDGQLEEFEESQHLERRPAVAAASTIV